MSRKCDLSNKESMVGNRVSHAKNRTKVRLLPNVHKRKIFSQALGKYVSMRISTSALRTVNKIGLDKYCAKIGISLS